MEVLLQTMLISNQAAAELAIELKAAALTDEDSRRDFDAQLSFS